MKLLQLYMVFFMIFSFLFGCILSRRQRNSEEFYFDRNGDSSVILANHSIVIFQTNSIFRCSWSCVKSKECVSLNFSPTEGFCQLNDAVAAKYPEDVQPQDGHWYFELRGKSLQRRDLSLNNKATTHEPSSSKGTTKSAIANDEISMMLSSSERSAEKTTRAVTTADKTTMSEGTSQTSPGFGTEKTTTNTSLKTSQRIMQASTTSDLTTSETTKMSTTAEVTTVSTAPAVTTIDLTTYKTIVTTEESMVITGQPTTLLTTVHTTTSKTTTEATTGGEDETTLPYKVRRECYEYLIYAQSLPLSGVYVIQNSFGTFPVYCDFEDLEGWTVIQRRIDNSIPFDRDWSAYVDGFGDINANFWLGLKKISSLCNARDCELLVVMKDWVDEKRSSLYGGFSAEDTQLYVTNFIGGDAGNSLPLGARVPFSTFDAENDSSGDINCANVHRGGWWYTDCGDSSPNGFYYLSPDNLHSDGIVWKSWQGDMYSLKSIELKVRNTNIP